MPIDGIATVTAATSVSSARSIVGRFIQSYGKRNSVLDLRPQVVSIVRWFMRDRVDLGLSKNASHRWGWAAKRFQGSLVFEDTYVRCH